MTLSLTFPPAGLHALALAVAMYICMRTWNTAQHRQAKTLATALSGLFWILAAALVYDTYRHFGF